MKATVLSLLERWVLFERALLPVRPLQLASYTSPRPSPSCAQNVECPALSKTCSTPPPRIAVMLRMAFAGGATHRSSGSNSGSGSSCETRDNLARPVTSGETGKNDARMRSVFEDGAKARCTCTQLAVGVEPMALDRVFVNCSLVPADAPVSLVMALRPSEEVRETLRVWCSADGAIARRSQVVHFVSPAMASARQTHGMCSMITVNSRNDAPPPISARGRNSAATISGRLLAPGVPGSPAGGHMCLLKFDRSSRPDPVKKWRLKFAPLPRRSLCLR